MDTHFKNSPVQQQTTSSDAIAPVPSIYHGRDKQLSCISLTSRAPSIFDENNNTTVTIPIAAKLSKDMSADDADQPIMGIPSGQAVHLDDVQIFYEEAKQKAKRQADLYGFKGHFNSSVIQCWLALHISVWSDGLCGMVLLTPSGTLVHPILLCSIIDSPVGSGIPLTHTRRLAWPSSFALLSCTCQ